MKGTKCLTNISSNLRSDEAVDEYCEELDNEVLPQIYAKYANEGSAISNRFSNEGSPADIFLGKKAVEGGYI